MAIAAAAVSLAALYTAGKKVRDALNFEQISVASASKNLCTRTGMFMCIEILVSWIESDTTITDQSRDYILTRANVSRVNMCAARMQKMGHEKLENKELRVMLSKLLTELKARYKERRGEDELKHLVRKVEDTKSALHAEFTDRVNVEPLDLIKLSFEGDEPAADEDEHEPEAQSLDELLLELEDVIEKCGVDPCMRPGDATFLINDRVLDWQRCLTNRVKEYKRSMTGSLKVGIAYDITTLTTFLTYYIESIKKERAVSREISVTGASCRNAAAADRSTKEPRSCAQCVQS